MTVIDTNTSCIDPIDTLRAKGVTAVGRHYRVVQLTKAEAQKLSGAQIELFTVYEDTGHNLTLTAAQGKIDGQNALKQATEVGQPVTGARRIAFTRLSTMTTCSRRRSDAKRASLPIPTLAKIHTTI
jgi:Domain of unknown function (DUF1906)